MLLAIRGSYNARALALFCVLILSFSFFLPSTTSHGSTSIKSLFKTGNVDLAAEKDFLNRTNALRASKGLGALQLNEELLAKARGWSQTQASSGTIFHSNLATGVTQNWKRLGENVGMGPSVGPIHDALVRSPRHYENLIDPGFTQVGIGVVRQGDIIYVTQVFMEFMPAASTPAPKSQPQVQSNNASAPSQPVSQQSAPIVQSVPLKTASPELNAIVMRISELESNL